MDWYSPMRPRIEAISFGESYGTPSLKTNVRYPVNVVKKSFPNRLEVFSRTVEIVDSEDGFVKDASRVVALRQMKIEYPDILRDHLSKPGMKQCLIGWSSDLSSTPQSPSRQSHT